MIEQLDDPDAVLVLYETGFLKKGTRSAGAAQMYSGTAGRIENCQIGVFLAYATAKGHTLIDRALYLLRAWMDDRPRCREAHIPEEVQFAAKPRLARKLLERALTAGVRAKWAAADEVYGSDYRFRRCCEELGRGYVVAISSATHLFLNGRQTNVSDHPPPADFRGCLATAVVWLRLQGRATLWLGTGHLAKPRRRGV